MSTPAGGTAESPRHRTVPTGGSDTGGAAGGTAQGRNGRSAHPSSATVGRLAALVSTLHARRRLGAQLAQKIEPLRIGGLIAVAGEARMLSGLEEQLTQAESLVTELAGRGVPAARHREVLAELDRLLGGAAWRLAEEIDTELAARLTEQEQVVEEQKSGQLAWSKRLRPVRRILDEAVATGAMVESERKAVARLEGLVDQLGRALEARRFDEAALALFRLDHPEESSSLPSTSAPEQLDPRKLDELGSAIQLAIYTLRDLSRRAELILLRVAATGPRIEYTLLLRSPSARGAHGVNLQGSTTIVQQDHGHIEREIEDVTTSVNSGRARTLALVESETTPEAPSDAAARLRRVGQMTYRLIMPDGIHRLLSDLTCSLTITTNELTLPWELMHDDEDFLCLSRPLARMPMGWAFPRRARDRDAAPLLNTRLRFLLIYSDPKQNLAKAREEIVAIESALTSEFKERIEVVTLMGPEATGRALNDALMSGTWDVVHYAGHAAFDPVNPGLSGLLLADEEVFFAEKIQRLLEGQPLVFLNACETSMTANEKEAQVTKYLAQPAEGLAASFVYGGALGCIGSLWPVYDEPAAQLAVEFYKHVLHGQLVGEALRLARRHIRDTFPGEVTWASYILYGDPAFQLAVPAGETVGD